MTPQVWIALVGMVGSAFVTAIGVAWYLATRLGKQDIKIATIEVVTDLTRQDVAFLRRAKEKEMESRGERARVVVRDRGWGVIEGRSNGNGRADDDE